MTRRTKPIPTAPTSKSGSRARPPRQTWLLAGATALLVARPLVASEGVAWMGDGLPFNVLWFLLAVLFCLQVLLEGRRSLRFGWTDAAMVLLVSLCATSAWISRSAAPRPAVNMLWHWIALGAAFLLLRQLVTTAQQARAVIGAMVALAVALSAYGIYQRFVGFPIQRDAYRVDPDRALRAEGVWYPPGSTERQYFETRLNNDEPLGTFALTNSLAGFLAAWTIVALGIVAIPWNRPGESEVPRRDRLLAAAAPAVCTICLALTKSRSAYVATILGLTALAARCGCWKQPKMRIFAGLAAAGLVALGAAALFFARAGGLAQAAVKSLGYRLEYWQATVRMIADHPWWGVGPAHFQDYYTRYKLPEASEEVRDPHNFILEVWATAGTPAVIALGLFIISLGAVMVRARRFEKVDTPHAADQATIRRVFSGAAFGVLLAYIIGPAVGLPLALSVALAMLLVGSAAIFFIYPWIAAGQLRPWLPALAVLVLATHLLASGGIQFPALAETMVLCAALALNLSEQPADTNAHRGSRGSRIGVAAALAASVVALALCYLTGYAPVLRAQAAVAQSQFAAERGDAAAQAKALREATGIDPYWADPWQALAELEIAAWLAHPQKRTREHFDQARSRYLALRPRSSVAWRQNGRWMRQAHSRFKRADDLREAIDSYRRAVELYPNNPLLHAELAMALDSAGQSKAARREAATALRLDTTTPHVDKKLTDEVRKGVATIITQK